MYHNTISIHALLAESDKSLGLLGWLRVLDFYPRSPCGERPSSVRVSLSGSTFLSTLSLRRATRITKQHINNLPIFLSTLSLRRATKLVSMFNSPHGHFYPRSPCGERHTGEHLKVVQIDISIHALLAESDQSTAKSTPEEANFYPRSPCGERRYPVNFQPEARKFLSTLSLRRATLSVAALCQAFSTFLSTLSLRRATPDR